MPARVLVVVLGGVEQLAVGGENAMAEKVAVGLRGEPDGRARAPTDRDAETAGTPREGDPFAAVRPERDVVTAARQLDRFAHRPQE